jgi:preprotein translocase subunit SecB
MSERRAARFSIEKIYVKDLSLEVPNAPQIFLEREAASRRGRLQSEANGLGDGMSSRWC